MLRFTFQEDQNQALESFAFVMNVRRLIDAEEYILAPGHLLRRATDEEIISIQKNLELLVASPVFAYRLFWERALPYQGTPEKAPRDEWRYFVVAFKGEYHTISRLIDVFDLGPVELEVGFTITYRNQNGVRLDSCSWHGTRLFHVLESAWNKEDFFVDVSSRDASEIAEICTQLETHNQGLLDVYRLCRRLGELKAFPHSSPLRFLGYFAVLESLITHAPKPSDPYDSITRQVKKKITLLENRWKKRLDYSAFGGASADTVWSKMYGYRSLLSHGGTTDFAGDLAILGDHDRALSLLKETVKSLVRHSLLEPQLLIDLRDC
jgi:hypothetical protein